MNRERKLQIWASGKATEIPEYVPRPTLGDVLYVEPNPDRTRKMCANCFMWQPGRQTCMIHDPVVIVVGDMVCGYHVYGTPQAENVVLEGLQTVDPENSSLERVSGGTSCDNCAHYRQRGQMEGSCVAVSENDAIEADALVSALGCCTRWRAAL